MSEERFSIFVVDDDPVAQMITVDQLDDPHFDIDAFDSGEACLAALDRKPDLILMDVEMPGRDGISVCRDIRAAGDQHAQVIFISSHDDLETRLAAYDAGGNDYIVKPFAPEELAHKVRVAERSLQNNRGVSQQARLAQHAAFTAMSSLSEMGVVLQFLRASFACPTPEQLASALFAVLGQYALDGIVGIRHDGEELYFSSKGACSPLEASIVKHAQGIDRIFQFRDRMAVNYPRVTLLVPNLPLDDADLVGRLRDHLAIIAEGAEARLLAMESDEQRMAQAAAIVRAVSDLTHTLKDIEAQQSAHRFHALELSNAYLEEVERAFVHLGLSEAQEAELIALAKTAIGKFNRLQEDSKSLGEQLQQVTASLQAIVGGTEPSPGG